jgi:hypothetical protein
MRKTLEYGSLIVITFLGLFHTVTTILFMRPFDLDALMYVGTGISFLFVALFNLSRILSSSRITIGISILSNAIILLYMVFIVTEVSDMRALSVILAIAILLMYSSLDLKNNNVKTNS